MGFEHRHRQRSGGSSREELAEALARAHRLELERSRELLHHAERAAAEDPQARPVEEWFATLAARAPGRQPLAIRGGEPLEATRAPAFREPAAPPSSRREPGRLDAAARWRMSQAFGFDLSGVSVWRDSPRAPIASGRIDREADGTGVDELAAPDHLADALAGSGAPLPDDVRRRLEALTGADLSAVRLRTGAAAERAAAALGARAFAIGRDIVFGAGRYQPGSTAGLRLLAHEVAHTVQQAGATPRLDGRLDVSRPGDAGEREAERFADAFVERTATAAAPVPAAAAPVLTAAPTPGALVQGEWERGQHLPAQETSVAPGTTGRDIGEIQESGPPIRMHHFEGENRSARPVLLIGGMHGDERAGIEVVDILLDRLQAMTTRPPQDIYVIPILHPLNAERRPRGSRVYRAGDPGTGGAGGSLDPNRDYPDEGRARAGRGGRPRYEGTQALMRVIERIQATNGQPPRVVQVHGTVHRGRDPDARRGPRIHDRAGISRDEQDVPAAVRDELRRQGRDEELAQLEEQARRGTEEDTTVARDMAQAMRDRGHRQSVRGNDGDRVSWGGGPTHNSLGQWGSAAVSEDVPEGEGSRRVERPAMSVITVETAGDEASVDLSGTAAEARRGELMTLADVIEEFLLGTRARPAPAAQAPGTAAPGTAAPGTAPVQQAAAAAGDRGDPDRIHALAETGLGGPGGALPHLDEIQRAFGHHDVTGVAAHVGGPASEAASGMNALAYASGARVAFARDPELHQAAHEAAHVVQQRGGVHLDDGVGRRGDPYEHHADAVADRVVRGESAVDLLDRAAPASARGAGTAPGAGAATGAATGAVQMRANVVALPQTAREERMHLGGRASPGEAAPSWETNPEALRAVQERLLELGCLERSQVEPLGTVNDETVAATRAGIARFQAEHGGDIGQIRGDAIAMRDSSTGTDTRYGNDAAVPVQDGVMRANDATHQALVNAWPRTMFGQRLENAEQGYQFIAGLVRSQGLPFDANKVNVVGIRGYQAGGVHGRVGTGIRESQFDDTMFILAYDEDGNRVVREFRGTTEPGGRSADRRDDLTPAQQQLLEREQRTYFRYTQEPSDSTRDAWQRARQAREAAGVPERDPDTEAMATGQQLPYRLNTTDRSKLGRVTITPRTDYRPARGDARPQVYDADPDRTDLERGQGRETSEGHPIHRDDNAPTADGADPAHMHDRLRTVHGRSGESDRDHGIAMHSGAGGDQVNAESTGCQVVHGDWYGNYAQTLRRALAVAQQNAHGGQPEGATSRGGLASSGYLLYSLLEGRALAQLDHAALPREAPAQQPGPAR